jgi:hypothetical protein
LFSPVVIAQIKPTAKIQLARAEYYSDEKELLLHQQPNGFKTYGFFRKF